MHNKASAMPVRTRQAQSWTRVETTCSCHNSPGNAGDMLVQRWQLQRWRHTVHLSPRQNGYISGRARNAKTLAHRASRSSEVRLLKDPLAVQSATMAGPSSPMK